MWSMIRGWLWCTSRLPEQLRLHEQFLSLPLMTSFCCMTHSENHAAFSCHTSSVFSGLQCFSRCPLRVPALSWYMLGLLHLLPNTSWCLCPPSSHCLCLSCDLHWHAWFVCFQHLLCKYVNIPLACGQQWAQSRPEPSFSFGVKDSTYFMYTIREVIHFGLLWKNRNLRCLEQWAQCDALPMKCWGWRPRLDHWASQWAHWDSSLSLISFLILVLLGVPMWPTLHLHDLIYHYQSDGQSIIC